MSGPPLVHAPGRRALSAYDVETVRRDFPILDQEVHGRPLVYLDSAATTQKPQVVLDAMSHFYAADNANIHRAVHALGERATAAYEEGRAKVAGFIGAKNPREIVFTRGTTEAVNLLAQTFVRRRLAAGDEILLTGMEHHSNIVPWQLLAEEKGARLVVAPILDDGSLNLATFEKLIGPRTKVAAFAHVSNALGTVNPVKQLVKLCHDKGVPVFVDGAQAAPHTAVDVGDLGCDFYALSAHKMYGPTGIGALYGRLDHLEGMPPYQGGGEMIKSVSFEKTVYNDVPYRFEAGTPNIVGPIGWTAAIDWLTRLGIDNVAAHEHRLLAYATRRLGEVPGLRIIGTAKHKSGIVSFTLDGVHPHDVGTLLDREGVAVRTGHHCAQPVMKRFGLPATTRASFAAYNREKEIDVLVDGLEKVRKMFA